jgi:hypothetical protein
MGCLVSHKQRWCSDDIRIRCDNSLWNSHLTSAWLFLQKEGGVLLFRLQSTINRFVPNSGCGDEALCRFCHRLLYQGNKGDVVTILELDVIILYILVIHTFQFKCELLMDIHKIEKRRDCLYEYAKDARIIDTNLVHSWWFLMFSLTLIWYIPLKETWVFSYPSWYQCHSNTIVLKYEGKSEFHRKLKKMTNTYLTKKKQKEHTKNTGKWKDDQYVPHKKKKQKEHTKNTGYIQLIASWQMGKM